MDESAKIELSDVNDVKAGRDPGGRKEGRGAWRRPLGLTWLRLSASLQGTATAIKRRNKGE